MKKLIGLAFMAGIVMSAGNISADTVSNHLSAPAILHSCYSPQDTSLNTYQKFKLEAKEEIRDNEKRIERLRDKMLLKKDEAKATFKVQVDSLEAKNKRLKADLAEYKEDVKSDWRTFKQKFNYEMDKLKQSFDELKEDLK